jgi:hypothetical protein
MTRLEEMVALIQQAQQGDTDAYAEIVRRFQDLAYGYAYAYLNDFQPAQDTAQEAFNASGSVPSTGCCNTFLDGEFLSIYKRFTQFPTTHQ